MSISEISIVVGLVLSLVASVASIVAQRNEKKKGVVETGLTKGRDTIADRDHLIDQIQEERKAEREDWHIRMDRQDSRIRELQEGQRQLANEVERWRTNYWRAITYLRSLKSWADRYMPADIPSAPEIPADINSDI